MIWNHYAQRVLLLAILLGYGVGFSAVAASRSLVAVAASQQR